MTLIWELDFYSRPVLDDQQKKLWEVVICESPLNTQQLPDSLFRYAQFCPSTTVNSAWLRTALEEAIEKAGRAPTKVRFFRRQMNNMITKACSDLGIPAQPSRRTYALHHWLQQRVQDYYPTVPGYQEGQPSPIASAVAFQPSTTQPLPDALIGQQWQFVSLEAAAFEDMPDWSIDFSEAFPLTIAGLAPEAKVPGVVIYSPRALAIAGWMSGLELAYLKFEAESPARLILETGAGERWTLDSLRDPRKQAEAKAFEAAKQQANLVHFIAVQANPQSEAFTGFWLLQELNLA